MMASAVLLGVRRPFQAIIVLGVHPLGIQLAERSLVETDFRMKGRFAMTETRMTETDVHQTVSRSFLIGVVQEDLLALAQPVP